MKAVNAVESIDATCYKNRVISHQLLSAPKAISHPLFSGLPFILRGDAMAALTVIIDPADSSRLIFNTPVTLSQAIAHLWLQPPPAGSLRPDPAERAVGGQQRRFLIDKQSLSVVLSLRHGLADQYAKRILPIESKGKPTLPAWVPADVQKKIVSRQLAAGVHCFPGTKPFGKVVVWIAATGYAQAQVYQEFPEDIAFYKDVAKGDDYKARLLHKVYTQYNADMRQFVINRGMSPATARDELAKINEACFKLILEGMASMMTAGAGISSISQSIRASAPRMIATVERSGFVRGGLRPSVASGASALRKIMAEVKVNGTRLTEVEVENAVRTSEQVSREVAEASGGKFKAVYIPAGVADTVDGVQDLIGTIGPSKPFQTSGSAYPSFERSGTRIVFSKNAVAGGSPRGVPTTLRTTVRHEVGEILETGPTARWPSFGHIDLKCHWRSSARGATLPGTTRAEQILLLREAKVLAEQHAGSSLSAALREIRKLSQDLKVEADVFR